MRQQGERLHQRVWQLLPWYANGTLASGECRTVEEHLLACALCRDEAAVCRRLGGVLRTAEAAAPSPHPAQLHRLIARIQEEESAGGSGRRRWAAAWDRLRLATPRPVQGLVAAQIALLALSGALLFELHARPAAAPGAPVPHPPPALYRTLSEAPPPPAAGVQIRLVFAQDATERQVRELLLSIRAQVVGGPSPLGAYTVEIPNSGSAADPLESVLAHLRAQPQIRFAEKVVRGR